VSDRAAGTEPDLSKDAVARYAFLADLMIGRQPPPLDLVELGAAPGDQIAGLAERGYRATAVDLGLASDAWADGREGRMAELLAGAGVALVEWNLEDEPYPLPDESFDVVVMTEVFEHLREYPIRSLQESIRILRPGGHLYFTTPNSAYLGNRLRLARGASVYTPLPDWVSGLPHARHAREYTFDEITELMERTGFTVVVSTSRHFHVDSGRQGVARPLKVAMNTVARMRPTFGPCIVMVARKPLA